MKEDNSLFDTELSNEELNIRNRIIYEDLNTNDKIFIINKDIKNSRLLFSIVDNYNFDDGDECDIFECILNHKFISISVLYLMLDLLGVISYLCEKSEISTSMDKDYYKIVNEIKKKFILKKYMNDTIGFKIKLSKIQEYKIKRFHKEWTDFIF